MRSAVVRQAPVGHDDFESAEVPSRIALLTAVVEPENAEGENAVDCGGRLRFADANDRFSSGAPQQPAAHIRGPETMFQIHGRAKAVDLRAKKGAREDAFEKPLVVAPRGVARGGGAPVTVRDKFKSLRLRSSHPSRQDAQGLRAVLNLHHGPHHVAFFAPELQKAAPVRSP